MSFANSAGQIAWMIVPWFWVIIADKSIYADQADGVHEMSVIVGVICAGLGILPAIFCRGIDTSHIENRKNISLRSVGSIFKDLFKYAIYYFLYYQKN